ncbi:MAG: hypothetical protein JWM47_1235 [Acidimicrobiales bacterium]|nr:hypothetical protein [Acidimicrobiales bacterium]
MSVNDRLWATRLPADLYEKLTERAKQEERTPASVMRLLARLYVEADPGTLPMSAPASSSQSSAA